MNFWQELETIRAWAENEIQIAENWGQTEYLPYNDCVGVRFERVTDSRYQAFGHFTDGDGHYRQRAPYIRLI